MKKQKYFMMTMFISLLALTFLFETEVIAKIYPKGMISYWKFDDCTAGDTVGKNDGTISGAICTTGQVGKALEFNGYDFVAVPNDKSLNPSTYITVEAWIYPTSFDSNRAFVTKKWDDGWPYPYVVYQLCALNDTAYPAFTVRMDDGAKMPYIDSTDWLPTYEWIHLTGTYDGETLNIYVNGELKGEKTEVSGLIDIRPTSLYIGYVEGSTNNYFYGKIDEVAIYNRALTPEEIQQHYQNGLEGLGYERSTTSLQESLGEVVAAVVDLNLQSGISNSLNAKLQNAIKALDDANEHNNIAAINSLNAFINAVEAQRGKKITEEDANVLINEVNAIIVQLEAQQ